MGATSCSSGTSPSMCSRRSIAPSGDTRTLSMCACMQPKHCCRARHPKQRSKLTDHPLDAHMHKGLALPVLQPVTEALGRKHSTGHSSQPSNCSIQVQGLDVRCRTCMSWPLMCACTPPLPSMRSIKITFPSASVASASSCAWHQSTRLSPAPPGLYLPWADPPQQDQLTHWHGCTVSAAPAALGNNSLNSQCAAQEKPSLTGRSPPEYIFT